ncbi:MAG: Hpt domain-containing protein, partial [Pseudomonadota bacterium]
MIDWERVMDLREEVGPDDFMEVAELFLSEVGSVLE